MTKQIIKLTTSICLLFGGTIIIPSSESEKGPVYTNMAIVSYCEFFHPAVLDRKIYGSFSTLVALNSSKTKRIRRMNQDGNVYFVYYYEDINGVGYIPYD